VPPEDGLGLNQEEVVTPAPWPEPANPDPKDSISISEPWVPVGAKCDVKLMAKDEILEGDITTRP
jgi:hypothetical protein